MKSDLSFEQGVVVGVLIADRVHKMAWRGVPIADRVHGIAWEAATKDPAIKKTWAAVEEELRTSRVHLFPEGIPSEAFDVADEIVGTLTSAGLL